MIMTNTLPKKINREDESSLRRKLYIGYLYFKRYAKQYAFWIFLALFVLFVLNIIVRNTGNINQNSTPAQPDSPSVIKELVVNIDNIVPMHTDGVGFKEQGPNDLQLNTLKQQLLAEKEKNKKLEERLNNQELQISSALSEINQSFLTFNNAPQETDKTSIQAESATEQSAYYKKVKAALSKVPPVNSEKLSTSKDDNDQTPLTKKEG